ncbi:MAG: pilus assembly protein [Henriciella sp.]|nr:pilus assembly protein [Henriciella sp.]
MIRTYLNHRISTVWQRFGSNRRGNVVMLFALCLLPLMFVVGFAIDHSRQQNYQTKIQYALDFAVISTARIALTSNRTDDELTKMAQDFFNSELKNYGNISLSPVKFSRQGDLVSLTVSGDMPTTVMQVAGRDRIPLGTESAAVFGEPREAEIALVLDTSYSMNGSKLSTLRTAATDLVETLVVPGSDTIKMSITPFATYVNVGTDKKGESWLDVEANRSGTYQSCSVDSTWRQNNCVREAYACTRDGVSRTCHRWNCGGKTGPRTCTTKTWTNKWYGCVKSRDNPYNIKDSNYGSKPVVGIVTGGSWACPRPIQALTSDPTSLKSSISSLNASQNTYIATGLTWGFRTLSPQAPFDQADPYMSFYNDGGRKALILMSDGANTKSPRSDGKHTGSDKSLADDITEDVCDEIKAQQIELYTIAFEITDTATKQLLEGCATSADFYYDASNASELLDAFKQIGNEFREIALAR